MSVELRPMSEAEYAAWYPRAMTDYAADMVDAGIDAEAARAKAERDFPNLLPDGVATPGQDLYAIVEDGASVGVLWLAERDVDDGRLLFIYDIRLDEAQRGRGLGRAAMHLVEVEAARRGLTRVGLNVFGGNDAARGLYRSLGYDEIAVWMTKRL